MLLPPPSGCADTFSPGYADCMPATTQPQCLHSKMLNSVSNWLFPVPSPHIWPVLCHRFPHQSHLNGSFSALKVKAILSPGQRCLYLKQDGLLGFLVFFFFQHQELTGNTESISKGIPDVPDPYLTWQGHQ